mmetsp:Transcript_32109/g.84568  ORF Transcript_32109/g.84568 Transcript_32109/m.84568 type:complete len:85 (+) Transcript_32109:629-883(+)
MVLCEKLLEHAVWVNLHTQSGDLELMELRVPEGYGARWAILRQDQDPQGQPGGGLDSTADLRRYEFRGFLEPHMSGGWEKGWRH